MWEVVSERGSKCVNAVHECSTLSFEKGKPYEEMEMRHVIPDSFLCRAVTGVVVTIPLHGELSDGNSFGASHEWESAA